MPSVSMSQTARAMPSDVYTAQHLNDRRSRASLDGRLEQLSVLLETRRSLWAPRPFVSQPVSWESDRPQVALWLRGLREDEVDALEGDLDALDREAPGEWRSLKAEAAELCTVARLAGAPSAIAKLKNGRLRKGVKGRKWAQISAFAGIVAPHLAGLPLIDWCSGKGHLGRALAALNDGCDITLVERDSSLCRKGAELSLALNRTHPHSYRFVAANALDPTTAAHVPEGAAAMSLHACGALTDALHEHSIARGAHLIASALCCFHFLGDADEFTPRSALGRENDLRLTPALLRLPIHDEIVASGAARRARRSEMAQRAGFDLLARETSGADRYSPLGLIPRSTLRLSFGQFCHSAAEHAGVQLPQRVDWAGAQRAGEEYALRARALAMVRALYRRPIELWLVLDRAHRLGEAGRPVLVGQFCEREISPRTLMILSAAVRPA
jgi:hypothetical protein